MERLSKSNFPEFFSRSRFSIVHVDADWDGYRKVLDHRIRDVEPQFEGSVSFGYVDCDAEMEYSRAIGIVNVPSIAYYCGSKLCGVVIGMQQDIVGNIERMMRGEPLNQTNTLSRG
jgi:thioredoxin-like negative regulator of GroEL